MATTTQAYPESQVLEAVRQQLITVVGLHSDYVRIVASANYEVTQEERMICIHPQGRRPDINAGAGRRARPSSRTLRVYMHFRDSTDFAGDDRLLVEQAFLFEDRVLDALDDFHPMNEDNLPLTIEPLHIMESGGGAISREPVNDVGLCRCWLDFEYRVVLYNTTPQP